MGNVNIADYLKPRILGTYGIRITADTSEYTPAHASLTDDVWRLTTRIELMIGKVWGEQLIIAIHNLSKTSPLSYVELLQIAARTVVDAAGKE